MGIKKVKMKEELSNIITNLRVIAILIVVANHCVGPYLAFGWMGYDGDLESLNNVLRFIFKDLLCGSMMPTFFMLSGVLYYGRKQHYAARLESFWRKFDRLVIPYALVYSFCMMAAIPKIGVGTSYGHLWFLRDLFVFFSIALLFYRVKERYLFLCAFLCFLIFNFKQYLGITIPRELGYLMEYAVFFFGGYYVAKFFGWMRNDKMFKWIVLFVWIIALVTHMTIVNRLLFNIVLFAFMPLVRKTKVIAYLDMQSFRIYLIHHVVFFLLFTLPYFQWLYTHFAIFAMIVMFGAVILLTLGICRALDKIAFRYF